MWFVLQPGINRQQDTAYHHPSWPESVASVVYAGSCKSTVKGLFFQVLHSVQAKSTFVAAIDPAVGGFPID